MYVYVLQNLYNTRIKNIKRSKVEFILFQDKESRVRFMPDIFPFKWSLFLNIVRERVKLFFHLRGKLNRWNARLANDLFYSLTWDIRLFPPLFLCFVFYHISRHISFPNRSNVSKNLHFQPNSIFYFIIILKRHYVWELLKNTTKSPEME